MINRRYLKEEHDPMTGEELDYTETMGEEQPTPLPPHLPPLPKGFPGREKANLGIWFGDSKIRKQDGSPLRMFHGTNADFSSFKVAPGGLYGPGIYFTDDPELAAEYTTGVGGYASREGTSSEFVSRPNIIPAYLRVVRPYVIPGSSAPSRDLSTMVRSAGYDGIVVRNPGHPFHVVAVFDPRQVKSAIGNVGDYDWWSEDMTLESHLRRVVQNILREST